ncbi:hypothetical protein CDCA_CDCA05G1694 [Cyanidium caldarium]|uniref:Uncharacterized protein n=1 Tax=Cyanidium caldarium TaxID=2771 RepID=A0AAV9IU40_CYACA|nr:hypothetical protein CDCA_CDCA05G1694 [Cyanidium caldarium]
MPESPPPTRHWEGTKVAEVVARVQDSLNRALPGRSLWTRWADWYYNTYFRTNRITPLYHLMILVGVTGYALEYPHLRHKVQHEKDAE